MMKSVNNFESNNNNTYFSNFKNKIFDLLMNKRKAIVTANRVLGSDANLINWLISMFYDSVHY